MPRLVNKNNVTKDNPNHDTQNKFSYVQTHPEAKKRLIGDI